MESWATWSSHSSISLILSPSDSRERTTRGCADSMTARSALSVERDSTRGVRPISASETVA
eukprot:5649910-Prymnesium_polylepis.1